MIAIDDIFHLNYHLENSDKSDLYIFIPADRAWTVQTVHMRNIYLVYAY